MTKTHYDIFGVPANATQEEIKAAYRKLAFQYHPDRNQDKESSDVKMKEINFIYSILSNPDKRKWYDSTISYYSTTEEREERRAYKPYIYCNNIIVTDSKGKATTINVGDTIYYLVEIDKSIVTWKYKRKEYFDVVIKEIFDPSKRDLFPQAIKFDFNKTPLFLVHWGNSEMIIYREDFENLWISSATFKSIDKRKGVITGIILVLICSFLVYHFANKFSIDKETKARIDRIQKSNKDLIEEEKAYYKESYFASESEVNYILSEYYIPCTKEETKTLEKVEVFNIPDRLGISVGEIRKGETVIKLLKCPNLYKCKIKYGDLTGWISESSLEDPFCESEQNENIEDDE